jgi:hypothetical protein
MNIIYILIAILTILLLLSLLLCGLWLKSHPTNDPSSVKFHLQLGITTIICSLISAILLIVQSR